MHLMVAKSTMSCQNLINVEVSVKSPDRETRKDLISVMTSCAMVPASFPGHGLRKSSQTSQDDLNAICLTIFQLQEGDKSGNKSCQFQILFLFGKVNHNDLLPTRQETRLPQAMIVQIQQPLQVILKNSPNDIQTETIKTQCLMWQQPFHCIFQFTCLKVVCRDASLGS